MPKGFNKSEKQMITESLLEHGKTLFSTHGLQKTSIQDITKKVGIAAGSFYKFYRSKEELYFEILEREESHIKTQLLSIELGKDPRQSIKDILLQMIQTIESNPLIQQLYLENNMEGLIRKLPPEILEEHFNKDSDFLSPLIKKWQKEGLVFTESTEVIAGIFRSFVLLSFQQEKIGITVYQKTIQSLISHTIDGLLKEV
jgi:AcrR family transcriptional regulator